MASRLQDVILRGLAAVKPLATAVAPGTLYYSIDAQTTERSNGTIWESYADVSGVTTLKTVTSPPGSPVNSAIMWTEDDGTGKTRLMVRFPTGPAIQLAIEP